MTGAMYASIAGLKTHMQKLNVIGNNVANLNTAGYKTKRTVFQDSVYTQYISGSNGTTTMAGINPSQIGYGVRISTIDLDMSTGSYNAGNPTDCMLDGEGFFLVGQKDVASVIDAENPESFKSLTLTRVGNFEVKEDGYLANNDGNAVYGFMVVGTDAQGNPIVSDQLVPLRMPEYEIVTTTTTDENNQTVTTTEYVIRRPIVVDEFTENNADGGSETKTATKDGAPKDTALMALGDDQKQCAMMDYSDYLRSHGVQVGNITESDETGGGNQNQDQTGKRELGIAKLESINISATGKITGVVSQTKEQIVIGYIAVGFATNPNGVTHTGGHYYSCGEGAGDLTIASIGGVLEDVTSVSGVGGQPLEFVNGSLVEFDEDAGDGDRTLADVLSSKSAISGTGKTKLMSGFLEGSNADLATEISELITTQRGYQANTRIVTVTDSMLEELVNMKR